MFFQILRTNIRIGLCISRSCSHFASWHKGLKRELETTNLKATFLCLAVLRYIAHTLGTIATLVLEASCSESISKVVALVLGSDIPPYRRGFWRFRASGVRTQ